MIPVSRGESIDELLDRAVQALRLGDPERAAALANQVLAAGGSNQEAEDLLLAVDTQGQLRRLTLVFIDLVDSTVLSGRVEPETYRMLMISYRNTVTRLIGEYQGHIDSVKGDGLLAVFGHPATHEDDAHRAVAVGLDIVRAVEQLSDQAQRKFGVPLQVRIGVHRGVVYVDTKAADVDGFAVNLTQRIATLAEPDSVAVSDAVAALVTSSFELSSRPPVQVKGVGEPVPYQQVLGERTAATTAERPALVGRHNEQARLHEVWEDVVSARTGTTGVALRGEAGIGKTRLAQAIADLVRRSGGEVVELRGSPLHRRAGLYPIRRLMERRCGMSRLTGGRERLRLLEVELSSLGMDPASALPLLGPVLGVGPEHGYERTAVEGRTLYQMIAATVRDVIVGCLGGRPGLIVAEDVHWFDPSTAEIIGALLASPTQRHLVVLTGRDIGWPEHAWPVEFVDLQPLSDAESDELINTVHPGLTTTQRARVRARCDGVPFFIEHVARSLDLDGPAAAVPDTLYAPLAAQMHADPDAVPVLEAAAVIGRSGDIPLLRSVVADETSLDVGAAARQLARAGVFILDGDRWRFRHELLREMATELTPPSRHHDLHARAAKALVDASIAAEPDWSVVAAHYEHAQQCENAVDAYRRASIAARHRGALNEATALLSHALEQLDSCPAGDSRDRTEIAVRLERGFLTAAMEGSWSGAGPADFERCLALSLDGGHDDELFRTMSALIGYYIPRAELQRARDLLDSLSCRLTRDRPWSYPAIESSLGSVLWMQGHFASAQRHLDNALTYSADADPAVLDTAWWVSVDPISVAHVFRALTAALRGDLRAAEGDLAASALRCASLGFPQQAQNLVHSSYMEVWVRLECGDREQAGAAAAHLRALSKSAGLDFWRFVGTTVKATLHGVSLLHTGTDAQSLADAAGALSALVDGARQVSLNSYLPFHDAIVGRLLLTADQPDRAREYLDGVLAHTRGNGMNFYDAELLRIRAATLRNAGDRLDAAKAALAVARRQDAPLFELRCLLDICEVGGGRLRELAAAVQAFPEEAALPELLRARNMLGPDIASPSGGR